MKLLILIICCIELIEVDSQEQWRMCDSTRWRVYMADAQGKDRYRQESKIVKDYIKKQFKSKYDTSQNGYITFRYFINCYGKPGNYSILQQDKDYNKISFKKQITDSLFSIVSKLDIYKVKYDYYKGKEKDIIDYFIFFTFKIRNGEIEAILP